ncbi:MAG: hypothetical protein KIS88_02280 [Anaerolineales bacterium]|nr:hypothetical protein [Anaerolineales bacterium]
MIETMALLAEEIVEEWLNRQGWFTIRGIKLGVHEIDLLAMKVVENKQICRHIEVTASNNPVSYITSVPKAIQKETGRKPSSSKLRTAEELQAGIHEWIDKKFNLRVKRELREMLYPGDWSFELVINEIRHPLEVELFEKTNIQVHRLKDILSDLKNKRMPIQSASGTSLVDLIYFNDQ